MGRISGAIITMLGVLYALFLIESVLYTFLLTETLATFVGIGVVGGIIWRRANRWGAVASLVSSLATNFVLYSWMGKRLDAWDPNVFLAALLVGGAALVIASLLTQPEPAASIDSFFDRLATSSDGDDRDTRPQPLLLTSILHLRAASAGRGWRAFREDLNGFALGWSLVIVLVIATALLLSR